MIPAGTCASTAPGSAGRCRSININPRRVPRVRRSHPIRIFRSMSPTFCGEKHSARSFGLSTSDIYNRGGSAGTLDMKLDALVWGVVDGRRLSAPLIQIDHFSSGFDGGRWILLSADLGPDFYSSAEVTQLLRTLAARALEGALQFSVRPVLPLYLTRRTGGTGIHRPSGEQAQRPANRSNFVRIRKINPRANNPLPFLFPRMRIRCCPRRGQRPANHRSAPDGRRRRCAPSIIPRTGFAMKLSFAPGQSCRSTLTTSPSMANRLPSSAPPICPAKYSGSIFDHPERLRVEQRSLR